MRKLVITILLALGLLSSVASAEYVKAFEETWTVDTSSIYWEVPNESFNVLVYKKINEKKPAPYTFKYLHIGKTWQVFEAGEGWVNIEYNSIAGRVLDTCLQKHSDNY